MKMQVICSPYLNWRSMARVKLFVSTGVVTHMLLPTSIESAYTDKSKFHIHIVTPFTDLLFGVIHSRTLLENLLSVMVTHSSVLY